MKRLLFLFVLIFFVGCAHIKSGHYVQVKRGETIERLASLYDLSPEQLQAANAGKSFTPGQWVFIPLHRGLKYYLTGALRYSPQGPVSGSGALLWPVPSSSRISSYFGKRSGRPHEGIDIPAKSGSHILAAGSGRVIYSGRGIRGYGNMIVLVHQDKLYTVYAHNRKNFVSKGDKVHAGQVIGQVGNTGRSTGPHLHFEVRISKNAVDPLAYLGKSGRSLAKR